MSRTRCRGTGDAGRRSTTCGPAPVIAMTNRSPWTASPAFPPFSTKPVRAPRPSCGTANVMSVPPFDIAEEDWAIVRDILHRHVSDYTVWAFGSRAKRTARRFSDLDLAIITDTPLLFDVGGALGEDFSDSDLPFRVDILDWATTSEAF